MIRFAYIDVINSGPYIEQPSGSKKPIKMADGTYLFAFPLPEGAISYIYLDDLRISTGSSRILQSQIV
jgi:hypothetical protein